MKTLEKARGERERLEGERRKLEGAAARLDAEVAAAGAQLEAARKRVAELDVRARQAPAPSWSARRGSFRALAKAQRLGPGSGRRALAAKTCSASSRRSTPTRRRPPAGSRPLVARLEKDIALAAQHAQRRPTSKPGPPSPTPWPSTCAPTSSWPTSRKRRCGSSPKTARGTSRRLSLGRYSLVAQDQEFAVVDHWNADSQRSVKTLSGGETFLASLSLALALAEGLAGLAVEGRAGEALESLFLDEGFGTLDPETLGQVVQALDALHGGRRLVGVVTHIPELAAQLPARVEVERAGARRGSGYPEPCREGSTLAGVP